MAKMSPALCWSNRACLATVSEPVKLKGVRVFKGIALPIWTVLAVPVLLLLGAPVAAVAQVAVKLEWSAIEGADNYDVEVNSVRDIKTVHARGRVGETSYKVELLPGSYVYRVRGVVDATDVGPWSDYLPFEVSGEAPSLLRPENGAQVALVADAPIGVRLEWTAAKGLDVRYRLQVFDSRRVILLDREMNATLSVWNAPARGKYQWRVAAIYGEKIVWSEVWTIEVVARETQQPRDAEVRTAKGQFLFNVTLSARSDQIRVESPEARFEGNGRASAGVLGLGVERSLSDVAGLGSLRVLASAGFGQAGTIGASGTTYWATAGVGWQSQTGLRPDYLVYLVAQLTSVPVSRLTQADAPESKAIARQEIQLRSDQNTTWFSDLARVRTSVGVGYHWGGERIDGLGGPFTGSLGVTTEGDVEFPRWLSNWRAGIGYARRSIPWTYEGEVGILEMNSVYISLTRDFE